MKSPLYCLDANVLIQPWNKYYSPKFCKSYWSVIDELGKKGFVFIPQMVKEEILKIDDELSAWIKSTNIPIRKTNAQVTQCVKQIFEKDSRHERLVDSTKHRSVADPWVIAHAMSEGAVVVTKEEKITSPSSPKIKIPNVCESMGVEWIDDFEFIRRTNIQFNCCL